MTTEASEERCGSLTVTDFHILSHAIFYGYCFPVLGGVEKNTHTHTVKIAQCLLLFHSQFDGENMYMSMTEPSQDYVPASQVG